MVLRPFIIPIKFLQFLGIWQDEKASKAYKIYGILIHLYVLEHGTVCQTIHSYKMIKIGDILEFIETLSILLTCYVTIFKSIIFIKDLSKIKNLMSELDKLLKVSDFFHSKHRKHVSYNESTIIKVSNLKYTFHFAICNMSLILAVISINERRLPFKTWFYFDYKNHDGAYAFLIFIEYVMSVFTILANTSLDVFPVIFMCYVHAILKELKDRMGEIREVMKSSEVDLRKCVNLHVRILKFCDKISHVYALHLLVQTFFSSLILCSSTFLITKVNYRLEITLINFRPPQVSITEDSGLFFRTLIYVILMFIQIFLPCYYGNEIFITSQELTTQVFHSEWLSESKEYKKSLKFIMEISKKPIKITSYNLLKINYETFTSVCNAAYSLYALLERVSKKNN